MLRVRVAEVVHETADAHTLVLEPLDGAEFSYRPGQFLTVEIPTDQPGGAARCYSLCTSPLRGERPAITVKRTRDGYASNWLCDHAEVGTELRVLPAAGVFVPKDLTADILLVAAGSGITPVMAILKSVLHSGTGHVTLVYANRDEASVIFAGQLRELVAEFPGRLAVVHWLESVSGLPTGPGLASLLSAFLEREAYVCGPSVFMQLVAETLKELGMPKERVHQEVFVSLTGDPFASPAVPGGGVGDANGTAGEPAAEAPGAFVAEVSVELDGTTRQLRWPAGQALLDVMLAAGLDAPYSCREGACSACACMLTDGTVDLVRNEVLDARDLADGLILACQARPTSERVGVTFDA